MSALENQLEEKSITIKLEPSLHNAMKALAKSRAVHITYVYTEAIEQYLNRQAPKVKK